MIWTGTIYTSATLGANGNSGWLDLRDIAGFTSGVVTPTAGTAYQVLGTRVPSGGFDRALLRMVPEALAGDETLDLDLNIGWDAAGAGDLKIHDFTQVTNTNVVETLIVPGEDSEAATFTATSYLPGPILPFWKLAWTVGGTTKAMNFTLYGCLVW